MAEHLWETEFEDRLVTYSLELDGEFILIENVPARIDLQTGERLFAPDVVEQIQHIVQQRTTPKRIIETPVYEFVN